MLTGKTDVHLVPLPSAYATHHRLQADTQRAFSALQQSAVKAGFDLQPASSFRDFKRQQQIWNGKFLCQRKVHDDDGNPLDLTCLDDWQKVQAILRWSALPGASRHHWGTEIDIYDPTRLPQGQALQLEPWEYEESGYFYDLACWLSERLPHFDFTLPFQAVSSLEIGREPWHISYQPLAEQAKVRFTPEILLDSWQNERVEGSELLATKITEIFKRFIA
ncbi:D-alanyl-D-alanine carboxypeptidase family protein [Testudinibacter sp. TR-2022]|uniref:M15 family metallopeptidase n=1 Tax=Testudinibacter sp. TR-2022 TaxID=2585029 RepID=UPI00111BBAC1|nr:M15 family metallopeptidase [Testudinibacter sp. TR-2022]TNH03575.1 D-alanyl-D-alanine carboxypeptidase family protein [Pasteurellaceae bacterium Phil31]TNH07354.1 D-alanyl-D-alanine carboxypeptidase family protein [Testudinibacter sp. TR-2022]TNH12850.1 D-alanyl-D-alanine carboxypeptidase family protein [Testudinibacter sp. TR-2022]TNH13366.1 D-alanyl-D-alanine carboxypeptidase family protein [Testudinibacter sp. TR-2022]TNH16371.1 D-alanyl-D-alanine carboxypeptidase family protein [Testud